MEEGRILMQGEPESALRFYYDIMKKRTERRQAKMELVKPSLPIQQGNRYGTQEVTITAVRFIDGDDRITDHIFSGSPLTVELEYVRTNTVSDMACTLGVFNENNTKCFEAYDPSIREIFGQLPERASIRCRLPELPLLPGRYYINVGLFPTDWSFVYDHHNGMHFLHVMNESEMPVNVSGVVMVRPHWTVRAPDPS
jgi:lipopolysaccharide transport system ATP-binding protein